MAVVTKYNFHAPLAVKAEKIPSCRHGWRRTPTLFFYLDPSLVRQLQAEEEMELPVLPSKKGGSCH